VRERLIFVESNTTGSGMRAMHTASGLGLTAVLLTSRPQRYQGLAETGAEVVECDTNSVADVAAAVSTLRSTVAGVTTTSEFYLVTAAVLAAELGVPGNPPDSVSACRDKARTREILGSAGVGQPAFACVRDVGQVSAAVARIGLPCVVKPVDESGSRDVLLCRTEAEAARQVEAILSQRSNTRGQPAAGLVLIEEFIDAPEYSVEMFSADGVAHPVGITAKSVSGLPWFVETGHLYPAPLAEDRARVLEQCASRALAAVGIRTGPTHTEVRLRPAGPAVIEINARLAGGMIPEIIRLADGVDLLEQQILAAVGRPLQLGQADPAPRRRSAGIRFLLAERSGILEAVAGTVEAAALAGITEVVITAEQGKPVDPARDSYGRLGYVIAHGASPAEVVRRLDAAQRAVRLTIVP